MTSRKKLMYYVHQFRLFINVIVADNDGGGGHDDGGMEMIKHHSHGLTTQPTKETFLTAESFQGNPSPTGKWSQILFS